MTWMIEFDDRARKSFLKLDKLTRERIITFLEIIEKEENPRAKGKALSGQYAGLWRYRVGDYRLICQNRR